MRLTKLLFTASLGLGSLAFGQSDNNAPVEGQPVDLGKLMATLNPTERELKSLFDTAASAEKVSEDAKVIADEAFDA